MNKHVHPPGHEADLAELDGVAVAVAKLAPRPVEPIAINVVEALVAEDLRLIVAVCPRSKIPVPADPLFAVALALPAGMLLELSLRERAEVLAVYEPLESSGVATRPPAVDHTPLLAQIVTGLLV